jgi:hypothetical protein
MVQNREMQPSNSMHESRKVHLHSADRTSQVQSSTFQQRRCYNCQSIDHFVKDCQHPRLNVRNDSQIFKQITVPVNSGHNGNSDHSRVGYRSTDVQDRLVSSGSKIEESKYPVVGQTWPSSVQNVVQYSDQRNLSQSGNGLVPSPDQ